MNLFQRFLIKLKKSDDYVKNKLDKLIKSGSLIEISGGFISLPTEYDEVTKIGSVELKRKGRELFIVNKGERSISSDTKR